MEEAQESMSAAMQPVREANRVFHLEDLPEEEEEEEKEEDEEEGENDERQQDYEEEQSAHSGEAEDGLPVMMEEEEEEEEEEVNDEEDEALETVRAELESVQKKYFELQNGLAFAQRWITLLSDKKTEDLKSGFMEKLKSQEKEAEEHQRLMIDDFTKKNDKLEVLQSPGQPAGMSAPQNRSIRRESTHVQPPQTPQSFLQVFHSDRWFAS